MGHEELGREYGDGTVIFREGDHGDTMYIIQKGKVKITKTAPEGEIQIATLGEGEIFGEMALFDRLPRSATVTAFGACRLLSIDKRRFFASISKDPTLAFNILEAMSARTRRLNSEYTRIRNEKFEILRVTLDLEKVCYLILEEARQVVEADNGSIMLLKRDMKTLRIISAFGEEIPEKTELKLGDGIAGSVLQTGQAQMVNNVSLSPIFKPGGPDLTSIVCVPLLVEDLKLGVLNLSTSSGRLFNMQDLRFIQMLASYAAIAIHNARNFEQLRQATEALTQIVQMLTA